MRKMIHDSSIERIEITADMTKNESLTNPSDENLNQGFYHEMECAVNMNHQHLREIEQMPPIRSSKHYLVSKRLLDIFVGVAGLILLSPLLLVVSILIKVDSPGPVIFRQKRVGKERRLFTMYKFRTMVNDAESRTGPVWAAKDDPRLTTVGKFLRNSKIDELPQLVNLIMGNMTMVGPRPERPYFVNQFAKLIPGYTRRLEVTPGITGLAQLRNGYDFCATDVVRKLRLDTTYMKEMSLTLDLKLLMETFVSTLTGKL